MTLRAVLFDAAETLFTTRGSVGEIYASVARGYGSKAPSEVIHAAFLRNFRGSGPTSPDDQKKWWKNIVHRVFSEVGMIDDFDRFFDDVYDRFRDSNGWMLYPETAEVLRKLKNLGLKLGVISNFDDRVYTVMNSLGIRSFFDTVTISSETGYSKPDPRIFQAAVRALQVQPDEILLVGDSFSDDVEAARAVGFEAVLIDRNSRYTATAGVPRISSLEDVIPLVKSL